MGLPLFLFTIIFVVLFAIMQFFRRREVGSPTSSHSIKEVIGNPEIVSESSSKQPQPGKTTLSMDYYRILQEATYPPVKEEICPTHFEDVDEGIKRKIDRKVSKLPPLSVTSSKLYSLLRSPHSSAKAITSIVSTNPVLSAKILRTVNSAYYGLPVEIASVGRAIILLGYNYVRSLVYQDTVSNTLSGKQVGERVEFNELWIHSTVVSVCAHYLGRNVFRSSENDLATIGLLHDIGKYFLHLLEDIGEKDTNLPAIIQEEKQYGVNHALMGSIIANKWQLPDIIVKNIEFHHYPLFFPPDSIPDPFRKFSFIVCLSDLICRALGFAGQGDDMFTIRREYFELFGLSAEFREIVTPDLVKEIEKAHDAVQSFINA